MLLVLAPLSELIHSTGCAAFLAHQGYLELATDIENNCDAQYHDPKLGAEPREMAQFMELTPQSLVSTT